MKKSKRLDTFLGEGTQIEGKLTFHGKLRINGNFKGEIVATGSLFIGEKAVIEGDIHAENILNGGEIRGTASADDTIEIVESGKVHGDIEARNIMIHPEAFLKGNCHTRVPNNKVNKIPVATDDKIYDKKLKRWISSFL